MDAFVSGQSGIAVLQVGMDWLILKQGREAVPCSPSLARQMFAGASDLSVLEDCSIEEARSSLKVLRERDQALQLLLILLNPKEAEQTRSDAGEALDELFNSNCDWLVDRAVAALENTEDYISDARDFVDSADVDSLLNEIETVLAGFRMAGEALRNAANATDGADPADQFVEFAKSSGLLMRVARAYVLGESVNDVFLETIRGFSKIKGHRGVITSWLSSVLPTKPRKAFEYMDEGDEADPKVRGSRRRIVRSDVPQPRRKIFEKVMRQQHAIVELLQANRLGRAVEFVDELIHEQLGRSRSIYAVKTLCNLSQQARRLELFNLQLEWARRATQLDDADSQAFGQLGNAYLSLYSLAEAGSAFERCGEMGDRVFSLHGRARILRVRGRLDEALELFRETRTLYTSDEESRVHSWLGEAEILREQDEFEDAIAVYRKASELYPGYAAPRCGVAAVLTDMGKIEEALQQYDETLELFRDDEVALSGKATTLKEAGRFDAAFAIFERLSEMYPTLSYGFTGKAEICRLKGQFREAEWIYREVCERYPTLLAPALGLAETFRDQGLFVQALKQFDSVASMFPDDIWPRVGAATTLRSSGDLPEALRRYDEIIASHPHSLIALNGRADVLRFQGYYEEALDLYDRVLRKQPTYRRAQHGRSAALSLLRHFSEAVEGLPRTVNDVRVREDWIGLHIRCMALIRRNEISEARRLLMQASEQVPFARYRRMFKRGLAVAQIESHLFQEAEQVLRDATDPATKIVWIHALCRSGEKNRAREVYNELRKAHASVSPDIRERIAEGCGIVPLTSIKMPTERELIQDDCEILLRDIAA